MLVKLPNKLLVKTTDFIKLLILKSGNNFVLEKDNYVLERFPPIIINTNTYTKKIFNHKIIDIGSIIIEEKKINDKATNIESYNLNIFTEIICKEKDIHFTEKICYNGSENISKYEFNNYTSNLNITEIIKYLIKKIMSK